MPIIFWGGESYWLWCFWFKKKCFDVGNWTTKRGSCVEESVSSTVLQGPIHWPPGEGQICRGGGETGQVCGESDETNVLRAHQPGSGLEGNSLVQSHKKNKHVISITRSLATITFWVTCICVIMYRVPVSGCTYFDFIFHFLSCSYSIVQCILIWYFCMHVDWRYVH